MLDEPTASLSAKEIARLHEIVRTLRSSGRTVILVSHFLNEVLDLADTVTVLRDGRVIRTGPPAAETETSLVAAMLGRPAARAYPIKRPAPADAPVALSSAASRLPGVHDVSLDVRAGEIVGLAGLIGAGRTELARAIYGARRSRPARSTFGAARLGASPAASLQAGLAMIPESRKDDGLFLGRPIRENVSLSNLGDVARFGFVRRGAERTQVTGALAKVSGSPLLDAPAGALSGGNQQKLLFARALLIEPGVLIADEPTRGVDVGAKRTSTSCSSGSRPTAWPSCSSRTRSRRSSASPTGSPSCAPGRLVAELVGDAITESAILDRRSAPSRRPPHDRRRPDRAGTPVAVGEPAPQPVHPSIGIASRSSSRSSS